VADVKFLNINSEADILKPTYSDIVFDATNTVTEVYDRDYVAQAVAKVLKTTYNVSAFYPNYGTGLDAVRTNVIGNILAESAVAQEVINALAYLTTIEESPSKTEHIASLQGITLESVQGDRGTTIKMKMQIVTESGTPVGVAVTNN
jgi:hypothetical protein